MAADGRGVVRLDDMESLLDTGEPTTKNVLNPIIQHKGLIFVSVEGKRNLDPGFVRMVDHTLETETDALVGVDRGEVEKCLRLLSDGVAIKEKMIEVEMQRRKAV